MKHFSFLAAAALSLFMLAVPSSAKNNSPTNVQVNDKKPKKKSAKIKIENISDVSFVVRTFEALNTPCITLVFDGQGGTCVVDGTSYIVKVSKWNPKSQKLSLNLYEFGNSISELAFDGYLSCYEGEEMKCSYDFLVHAKPTLKAWTPNYDINGKQTTLSLFGNFTYTVKAVIE